jgi:WD40 repeat protein
MVDGHRKPVLSVAFSPNGKIVASGGSDDTIQIRDTQTGQLIQTMKGNGITARSLAFSPDGKMMASGYYAG